MEVKMSTVKDDATKLISRLPKNVTWDDLLYELHVQKKIHVALDAVHKGKVVSHEEAKKRLLSK
jgi:hypothetical protein